MGQIGVPTFNQFRTNKFEPTHVILLEDLVQLVPRHRYRHTLPLFPLNCLGPKKRVVFLPNVLRVMHIIVSKLL